MLAQRVNVSASTQDFKCGVGVNQRIQGPVLPIHVFQQACVPHGLSKCAVEAWRLVAVSEPEQFVGHTLCSVLQRDSQDVNGRA